MKGFLMKGIRDIPTQIEWDTGIMPEIPQDIEDLEFGKKALEEGCGIGEYYEELKDETVDRLERCGHMVSSAFVHWEGDGVNVEKK